MSFVTLVRHGQANTAARDETGYDRLSDLGRRQCTWLGEYFRDTGDVFARVYTGTLQRHRDSAHAIAVKTVQPVVADARLNELEYFTLARLLLAQHGVPIPSDREGFVRHLPLLFRYWQEDRISDAPERFETFESRVRGVLHDIADGEGRALVVTSGGLIAMAMRLILRLDVEAMAHVCLAIENSSLHRVQPLSGGLILTQFNALPHLDTPERQHARSHL